MGYSTDFYGFVEVHPPLNEKEIEYLKSFADTRRMDRENGPYFVEGTGYSGQGSDKDIRDYNRPPQGQPGLWCKWEPSEDGTKIEWNGAEKFYDSVEWMQYLIDHFIGANPIAKSVLPFLNKHVVHGEIEAQGEERGDHWFLVVENNKAKQVDVNYEKPTITALDNELLNSITGQKTEDKKVTEENPKELYDKKKGRFNL